MFQDLNMNKEPNTTFPHWFNRNKKSLDFENKFLTLY